MRYADGGARRTSQDSDRRRTGLHDRGAQPDCATKIRRRRVHHRRRNAADSRPLPHPRTPHAMARMDLDSDGLNLPGVVCFKRRPAARKSLLAAVAECSTIRGNWQFQIEKVGLGYFPLSVTSWREPKNLIYAPTCLPGRARSAGLRSSRWRAQIHVPCF